jgi:hypothetical protein
MTSTITKSAPATTRTIVVVSISILSLHEMV